MAKEIAAAGQVETPYGHVVKTITIQEVVIPYVCPFALLHMLCGSSAAFANFLFACVARGGYAPRGGPAPAPARVALYVDEVVPGNNLRPDHARAFYAVFWLFLDYPDWFRSSAAGWHDLCVVKAKDVEKIDGGISAIVAYLMRIFFGTAVGAFNMSTLGVRLPGPHGEWVLRANFAVFLFDERAEKFIYSVKGSSGSKMCVSCRNVVGRMDASDVVAPFRHFGVPGLGGCDFQTFDSFHADFDFLHAQKGVVPQARFEEMEQALGIKFCEHALPLTDMRGYARIPESRFTDWMHTLCASGGVVQYQVNQFCLALSDAGVPMERLDTFLDVIKVPWGNAKLKRSFFKDRVNRSTTAHIKAFAAEVLSAVVVLSLFSQLVLVPLGVMGEHVALIGVVAEMLDILQSGDRAVNHVARLQDLCLTYHTQYMALIPQCLKPKLHYMHHTPRQIGQHGKNLACFAPERKHQQNKQACNFIFRHMEVALAARNADEMLRLAQEEYTYVPIHPRGTLRVGKPCDPGFVPMVVAHGDAACAGMQRCIEASTHMGAVHKSDVIAWRDARGDLRMGQVLNVWARCDKSCTATVTCMSQRGARWATAAELALVDLRDLRAKVSYARHEDGSVTPYVHSLV